MGVVLYAPSLALNAGEAQPLAAGPSRLGKHLLGGQVDGSVQKGPGPWPSSYFTAWPLAGLCQRRGQACFTSLES